MKKTESKQLRIIAVYKTFRGHEFALDSLASIYPHCRKIVFVHSDIGWNGEEGNTVRDVVKSAPDPDDKIVHIDYDGNQNEQYNAALRWIFENEERLYEYLMLIDTDEVWDSGVWPRLKQNLMENLESISPALAIRCGLYDYIKSPFFRIDPPAPLKPVVFLHRAAVALNVINVRGSGIEPSRILRDINFHHFCSVRNSLSEVWRKHDTSCTIESEPIVDKEFWLNYVWNRLPFAQDLLPLKRYRANWRGVKVIQMDDLPDAVRQNPLVVAWSKYPGFTMADCHKGLEKALQGVGLPITFGPGHPDWSIPSKQNKYNKMLEAMVKA